MKNDYRRNPVSWKWSRTKDGIVSRNAGLWADLRWCTSYKIVHGLVDKDPSEVGNGGRATRRSTSQHRFRKITANKNCYRVFLFSVDCPWVDQPARPSRSAYSVETFRAQLAQEIGIAALISRSHYYYDWDDCWPPVPYNTLVGALHRTDLELDPSIWVLKVATTHADLVLDKRLV